jgi:hypothetical protein
MNGFYYALDIIKDQLELDNDVNVVNTGIIEDVLLKKKDIYPYSHILVNNATLNGSTWTVSYSVICMDIVDISKEQTTNIFRGQNNVQDVLNTQFVVINRVLEVLRRGQNTHLYQLDGSPNCEPFEDRFEHGVAGWTVTFDLLIPNDMTVCATDVTPVKLCPDFEYTITDADSNVLYTGDILSGDSLVQVISNATVTNSLDTVLATILAQGTVELADVDNIDSDGSTVPTPAGVAFTCTPQVVCPAVPIGATIIKTNQKTSYRTGDDGDLEAGRATDFFTLASNNPFGNTNRFTDELGTQAYANDIVIDWTTYNGSEVLGFYTGDQTTPRNWNDAIDWGLALSVGVYTSGWKLPNVTEYFNVCTWEFNSVPAYLGGGNCVPAFNYFPMNQVVNQTYWTSTTYTFSATVAITIVGNGGSVSRSAKTATYRTIASRNFTVTGTTLS